MKRQEKLVIGLIMMLLVVIFALLNTSPAAINFGITTIEVPLILLIVILLLIGAAIAFFMGMDDRKEISAADLKKQVSEKEEDLRREYQKEVKDLKNQVKLKDEEITKLKEQAAPTPELPESTTKTN